MATRCRRLHEIFSRLRRQRRGALLPYFTAGYPSLAVTADLLRRAAAGGVAGVELGFPYSDSIADGPTISSSYHQALRSGLRMADVFAMVGSLRAEMALAISAMVSYSIVDRMGLDRFVHQAVGAGFDALIIPDLSLEEAPEVARTVDQAGLDLIMLVTPTSSPQRREQICRLSSGFLYYVSVAGITGVRDRLPADLEANVGELRTHTDLPICVGFGVGSPEQVRGVCRVADGAIVGSAVIRQIASCLEGGRSDRRIVETVGNFMDALLEGARTAG